ncbi:response regulator transcription factor [Verrucomicrobiales bacterium BCK34]|nr:response regulator transcription factor [Verrucomicrobiales bacterium BCK34]
MRVLYVEDAFPLRDTVALALRKSGFAVDAAEDGSEGLFLFENYQYDVAVLDVMLPKFDGLALMKEIRRAERYTPVLLLTAKGELEDRVAGLDSGADDYMVKPFALDELISRIRALSRRGFKNPSSVLRVSDLEVDTSAKTVRRAGVAVKLSAHELAVLEILMRKAGTVVSRSVIDQHFYENSGLPMSNVIDVVICSIRKKISLNRSKPEMIHTRRGLGYVLQAEQ